MTGLHFDITADNRAFLESLRKIQEDVKHTTAFISEAGKSMDFSTMEKSIISLSNEIKKNEAQIAKYKDAVVRDMKIVEHALDSGDLITANKHNDWIEESLKEIEELTKKTEEYQKQLSALSFFDNTGMTSQKVSSTMLFATKEEFDKIKELQKQISDKKLEIATYDGDSAGLVELEGKLTSLNSELYSVQENAANAARSLGEGGARAAAIAEEYYTLTDAYKEQELEVARLANSYNGAISELERMTNSGDATNEEIEEQITKVDKLSESFHNSQMELNNLGMAYDDVKKEYDKTFAPNKDEVENTRRKLRNLTIEIGNATLEFRMMSKAEQQSAEGQALKKHIDEMTREAGDLKDALGDVQQAINANASDTKAFDAVASGINVVSSAMGAATGIAAMFGAKEEDLQEIQTKLQASLAISNALTVIQNQLQEQSALMQGIANIQKWASVKATEAETAAKGKNIVITKSATVAQAAFNAVANANPYVLLATAILTVVGAIAAYSMATSKATKEEEERQKRLEEFKEELKATSREYGEQRMRLQELQDGWRNLKTEAEKNEFIKENKEEFKQLGIEVNNVSDAENLLVKNSSAIINSLYLRAKAAAYAALAQKKYQESLEKGEEADARRNNPDWEDKVKGFLNLHWGENLDESIKREARISSNQIASEAVDAGDLAEQYINKQKELLKEADDLLKNSGIKTSKDDKDKTTNKTKEDFGKQQKEYLVLLDKQALERQRAEKDMEFSTTQARIDAMEDGTEKTLAQIQLDYERQEEAIERGMVDLQRKKIEEAKALWEKNPANKGKSFDPTSVDISYTEAEKANRDALIKENEAKRKKAIEEVNKAELQAMNDYLKEYGSMEQKRLAIAQEYAQKIKDAKTEGERLSLQKELQEKQGALSFENIAMDIDWGAVFGGIENMTTEMMQRLYTQLKAFERTDEYRKADAGTKQQVADMISKFRQFVGNTDQSENITKMGDAVQKFNEAVLKYKEATEQDKIAREEYEKATSEYNTALANKESYDKKLAGGEITQEIYDSLAPTSEELKELGERAQKASENFRDTGLTAAKAKENVQSLGIAAREAADDVKGWVSKGVQDAKNSFLGKNNVMGFSNLVQEFENFDNFKGALDIRIEEGQLKGAMNSAAQVISNDIIPVVDDVGKGIMGSFSEGFLGAMAMYAKVAKMILQISNQVKEYVTGILDSFTELFKFEWLESLVVSITSSISNLVDAIFDLPENLYKALEGIAVNGVGNLVNGVLGRVGNVLSFGALSSKGVSSWFSNEDKTARTIQALTERNEKLQGSIENLTDEMEKSRGAEAIRVSREAKSLQEELNSNILQKAIAQAQYHSAHHSFNYYWDGYTEEEIKRLSNQIGKDWDGDIFNLSPKEMKKLRSNADMWDKILNTGKGGYGRRVAEYLDEYIDQAEELEKITDKLNETLTSTTKENVFDGFLSSLYDFADGVDDVTEDVAENWRRMVNKMVIDNVIGNSYQEEMEDWYSRLAELNERFYGEEITEMQYNKALDEMEAEYNRKVAESQDRIKRLSDAGIIRSKSDNIKDQSATANMADKATYEQFELYLGIATAQQIALEQGNAVRESVLNSLTSIQAATEIRGQAVSEIRELALTRNEYLLDIKNSNREMLNSFGGKMDDLYNLIEDRL